MRGLGAMLIESSLISDMLNMGYASFDCMARMVNNTVSPILNSHVDAQFVS